MTDRQAVVTALSEWTILITQFNGMVADRLGVAQSDLQCLYALGHHGPATVSELAARVNLTSGAASRMVDRLEAAGHVRRTQDPADRRRVVIEASEQTLDEVSGYYSPLNTRMLAALEPVDAAGLEQLAAFVRSAQVSAEREIERLAAVPTRSRRGRHLTAPAHGGTV
jgi:DNA-binding MarR family transcriptional regulator